MHHSPEDNLGRYTILNEYFVEENRSSDNDSGNQITTQEMI